MTTTKTGYAEMANLTIGSGTAFTYMACGTGTTPFSSDSTTLNTENQRAAATCSRVTTTNTNDTSQFVKTFSFSGTYAITEVGIFNAASVGTMLCAKIIDAINVVDGDSIEFTYQVKHS